MRPTKLIQIAAAAVSLLALTPTLAAARNPAPNRVRAPHPAGGCRLSIFAEPRLITSGESAQIFGQLLCTGGASTTGQTVAVFQRTVGTPGFQTLGTASTGAGGFYTVLAPSVTANSVFYATVLNVRSARKQVKVAPQITLVGPADGTQLHTGGGAQLRRHGQNNRVVFGGMVSPADAGAVVVLQRESSTSTEEWHAIQLGTVGQGGAYSISHLFTAPGDANIRTVVRPAGRTTVRGISNTLSYEISQAENPRLTINSSADPIAYGQPITLSGTLAGAANQSVTLLGHPRGTTIFTAVAKATTNGSGEYSFAQTPLQNTAYKVTGGGINSAVLFQGVKYVLTAGVSANAVQSGQALTFSGTVAPDHTGHVVYLERENAFNGGFHVVEVGTLAADSTYSISHPVIGSGKQVFRVRIPGDPENQAVSSSPFSVEVTPALPAALRPLTPSTLPSEGQV